ncbi:hypothetical protein PCASD_07283 [Puccinia coronata f. sp. avenae]|uniref:Uncharacterized protein n=1 Tax=Puccinia coronata f. sp. avenae TaxID=200324 RepID=A0A2N5URU6_9BASI|nr:hypothetical protein PCASD_16807 [Puccinia coronata f. sp. avenae]PLW40367.1 hypothetical protein PCASD_07283 [Puccinia coronata f. sp. avenae]
MSCSNLLALVPDAPDPCNSLNFIEYLQSLRDDMVGYWDDVLLKNINNSAKNLVVWREVILEFYLRSGEVAQSMRGELVRRGLPHITIEKPKNAWGYREDTTPTSILYRVVSPAGSAEENDLGSTGSSVQGAEKEAIDPPSISSSRKPPGAYAVRNRGSNPPFKGSTSRDASSSAASIKEREEPAISKPSPDYMMGPTHGRIIRVTDPIAASQGRVIFRWIPDPTAMLTKTVKAKTKPYQRKVPPAPKFLADQLEEEHDAQLRGPLMRLQHLVEVKMQADRNPTLSMLKEEATEIGILLKQIIETLEKANMTKYSKIKKNVLAYYESYTEACRLLQDVADVWIDAEHKFGEHIDLEKFEDTLTLLKVIKNDVMISVSRQMSFEMENLLQRMQEYVNLGEPHSRATLPSSASAKHLSPIDQNLKSFPERAPAASTMEEFFIPPEGFQEKRSIEIIGECFLNTLENLKKYRDDTKKQTTNFEHLMEPKVVLEQELQDLRRHLRDSGTAKMWSRLLTKYKSEEDPETSDVNSVTTEVHVELDTVIQDMLAVNYVFRALKKVLLGKKQSYKPNDKTFHDLAWLVSEKLRAALEKARLRQIDRLTGFLKSRATADIISGNRASFASMGLIEEAVHGQPDAMRWIKQQAGILSNMLEFDGINLSHEQAASHLKIMLQQLLDSTESISNRPYALLLNHHVSESVLGIAQHNHDPNVISSNNSEIFLHARVDKDVRVNPTGDSWRKN